MIDPTQAHLNLLDAIKTHFAVQRSEGAPVAGKWGVGSKPGTNDWYRRTMLASQALANAIRDSEDALGVVRHPQATKHPCLFQIDEQTQEATGQVDPFCTESCMEAFIADPDNQVDMTMHRKGTTSLEAFGFRPRCVGCGKQFDLQP